MKVTNQRLRQLTIDNVSQLTNQHQIISIIENQSSFDIFSFNIQNRHMEQLQSIQINTQFTINQLKTVKNRCFVILDQLNGQYEINEIVIESNKTVLKTLFTIGIQPKDFIIRKDNDVDVMSTSNDLYLFSVKKQQLEFIQHVESGKFVDQPKENADKDIKFTGVNYQLCDIAKAPIVVSYIKQNQHLYCITQDYSFLDVDLTTKNFETIQFAPQILLNHQNQTWANESIKVENNKITITRNTSSQSPKSNEIDLEVDQKTQFWVFSKGKTLVISHKNQLLKVDLTQEKSETKVICSFSEGIDQVVSNGNMIVVLSKHSVYLVSETEVLDIKFFNQAITHIGINKQTIAICGDSEIKLIDVCDWDVFKTIPLINKIQNFMIAENKLVAEYSIGPFTYIAEFMIQVEK